MRSISARRLSKSRNERDKYEVCFYNIEGGGGRGYESS